MGSKLNFTQGIMRMLEEPLRAKSFNGYKTDIFINSNEIGLVYGNTKTESKANAERIVNSWNSYDSAKDLLSEFVKMANNPTYGDLVWRLAVKEKAEAWLRANGGTF